MSFYSVCKRLLSGIIRAAFRVKTEGAENEPVSGAYLICANHISLADPPILGASLKGNPKYMAKKELLNIPLFGKLIKALGAYPVDRAGNDVAAIRHTVELLKNGQPVIMFPQGTRSRGSDPKSTSVRSGCAMISRRADVPVLPILIYAKGYRVRLLRRTCVRIGKPILREEFDAVMKSPDDYRSGAELIFSRITAMEDEDWK